MHGRGEARLRMADNNFAFDVTLPNGMKICVTENYEGDKYHVVAFETATDCQPREHYDTRGFETPAEIFTYLRALSS
jgi:hypothetical protein